MSRKIPERSANRTNCTVRSLIAVPPLAADLPYLFSERAEQVAVGSAPQFLAQRPIDHKVPLATPLSRPACRSNLGHQLLPPEPGDLRLLPRPTAAFLV